MRFGLVASILVSVALILLASFTGDADSIDPWNVREDASVPAGNLFGSNTLGQTIVSRRPRLHAIQILALASDDLDFSNDSRITLHVRQNPDTAVDIATASLPMSAFAHNRWVKFVFSPIENSRGQSLYFLLEASQAQISRGYASLWASSQDAYSDGDLYVGGIATNRDLVFRAYYEPDAFFLFSAFIRQLEEWTSPILWVFLIFFFGCLVLFLPRSNLQSPILNTQFLFLAVLGAFAFVVNLLQIRDTPVPLWKDSPVHAEFITQILSTGQLPPGQFYHFGFHVLVAFLATMSGTPIPQLMLVLGQMLLTLTGFTTWLLVRRLTGNEITALAGAICAWFLSPTPAYFATWGRYPLILGSALLPLALYFGIKWTEQNRWNPRVFLLALVTFLCMTFAHVRLSAFYLSFVAIYLMSWVICKRGEEKISPTILRVAILAILETLIVWLWGYSTVAQTGSSSVASSVSTSALGTDVAIDVMFSHHGVMLIALTVIGVLVAVWRRSRGALVAMAWFIVLYGFSLLPTTWLGGEYLSPSFVLLMAFLPMAIIIGELIGLVYKKTTTQSHKAVAVWIVTLVIVTWIGARDMIGLVNPATIIFSDADQKAMEWISQNTPRDAKFLINSDEWFAASLSPSDGGWWIPYRTGRRIVSLATPPADANALSRWITEQNVEWIYLGWRDGILRKADVICQPARYTVRYQQHDVAIVQVRRANDSVNLLPAYCAD